MYLLGISGSDFQVSTLVNVVRQFQASILAGKGGVGLPLLISMSEIYSQICPDSQTHFILNVTNCLGPQSPEYGCNTK